MPYTTAFQKALLISLLVLLSISQAGIVSAGTNVWTSIGPEGGTIHALAIDPATPTTLYAGTDAAACSRARTAAGTGARSTPA